MSAYNSVTISDNQVATSDSGPASIPENQNVNQGMLNDMQANPNSGKMRVTLSGEGSSFEQLTTIPADTGRTSGFDGPLSTLEDQFGRPLSDLTKLDADKCSIQVGKTRCSVATAMNLGLLCRTGNGDLIPSEEFARQFSASQQTSKPSQVDTVHAYRPVLDQFHQRAGAGATNAFITELVSAAVDEKGVESICADFAQEVKASDESLYKFAVSYVQNLMKSGLDIAARYGKVDRGALEEYVAGLPKATQKRALMAVHYGDSSAFQFLVNNFKAGIKA